MKLSDILEQARIVCRMRRLSYHTETCYIGWIIRFARHILRTPGLSREERVRSYLERLAPQTWDAWAAAALDAAAAETLD
jgi:hypothetical protein